VSRLVGAEMKDGELLSPEELDVLREMMNVASGRAAGTLSGIVNRHILMELAQVAVLDRQGIFDFLEAEMGVIGSAVEQRFSGGLVGTSMMMMDYQSCAQLVELLGGEVFNGASQDLNEQSVLYEVGNVILNSCVAMLGKQTDRRIHFALPRVYYHLRGRAIAENLISPADPNIYAIAMKSALKVGDRVFQIHILVFLLLPFDELQGIVRRALNTL